MYWSLLAAAVALAIGHYQVGAMSVWVTVLSFTLKGVLLMIVVIRSQACFSFASSRFPAAVNA